MQEVELYSLARWTSLCRSPVELRLVLRIDLWTAKSVNIRNTGKSGALTLHLFRVAATSSCTTLVGLRMAKDLLRIGARRLVGVGGELCWVRRPARLPIPPSDQRKRLKCPGSTIYMKSSTRNLKLPHRTRSRPHNSIGMTRLVSLHDLFCPHKHPDKLNRPRSPSIVLFLWRRDKLACSSRV